MPQASRIFENDLIGKEIYLVTVMKIEMGDLRIMLHCAILHLRFLALFARILP